VQPSVLSTWNELRFVGADRVQVRREQNGLADFIPREEPHDKIGTTGQNLLKFHFESGFGSNRCQEIRNALFTVMRLTKAGLSRRSSIGWSEGRIHAGERDEFGQEFFRARHGFRVAQASSM
jgi:hypothetical protein